mmetsp:Transcript_13351/g.42229  ORF Transcript_13351/g.42229 Transcript_13351/m.42229 type:complete len:80 (-) Transcript_13351:811-1050(-)
MSSSLRRRSEASASRFSRMILNVVVAVVAVAVRQKLFRPLDIRVVPLDTSLYSCVASPRSDLEDIGGEASSVVAERVSG